VLLFVICISILIDYLSITIKKNAFQIVKEMGIGWSLSNSFNCYNPNVKTMTNPDEQLKLCGNEIPTKELITSIKKYGFKTIRMPITWIHFIDESGTINPIWMDRVKEVVNWIIQSKLYCIINVDKDGNEGYWLSKGISSKNKFIYLWTQIANEFKNYNEYLIFQSMEKVEYKIGNDYDYITLLNLNQAFVDTVRNTGGKNSDRLLIVAGMNQDPELTCLSIYKIPIDPSRKLAISFNYYVPANFAVESTDNPWTWVDADGVAHIIPSVNNWGLEYEYKELFVYFENFKEMFVDTGYPVIISETGVLTEDKKDINSVREYLYSVFSITRTFDGIMACLLDNSNKKYGVMNYYDRVNDKWYDEVIRDNFIKIAKGNFLKFTDFSYYSNKDTVTNINYDGNISIKIGKKKVNKVIFNIKLAIDYNYVNFGVMSNNKRGIYFIERINGTEGKKNYDGSYTYTIDFSKKDCNDYIEVQKWWHSEYITFKYLSILFDKEYTFFDYSAYKNSL
jgi:endoglucanase